MASILWAKIKSKPKAHQVNTFKFHGRASDLHSKFFPALPEAGSTNDFAWVGLQFLHPLGQFWTNR